MWDAGSKHKKILFPPGTSHVVELVPQVFEAKIMKDKRGWLIDYYADWCPHCHHFAPTWRDLAKHFEAEKRIAFGALNCAAHTAFCQNISVERFPSIRAYHFPVLKNKDSIPEKGAEVKGLHTLKQLQPYVSSLTLPNISESELSELPLSINGSLVVSDTVGLVNQSESASDNSSSNSSSSALALRPKEAGLAPAWSTPQVTRMTVAIEDEAFLRLIDAEIAIAFSLRQIPFAPANAQETSKAGELVLVGKALSELHLWLQFLISAFPSGPACQVLEELAFTVQMARASEDRCLRRDEWMQALDRSHIDKAPPEAGNDPTSYWRICSTYSCGLWTLFHMVILGSTGSFANDREAGPPCPHEALLRIRGFVAHFFGCAECASHFIETFDSCRLGRCALSKDDVQGAALWLWQVHSAVTRRVALAAQHRSAGPWPPESECASCWHREDSGALHWDNGAVYNHLKLRYWRPEWVPGGGQSFDVHTQNRVLFACSLCGILLMAYFAWRWSRGYFARRAARATKPPVKSEVARAQQQAEQPLGATTARVNPRSARRLESAG
eukprot:gnl/TRDRNA2_/TRDRNA2_170471_c2_seq1.p1 gnl/TRDRNA2_/TRDRNA2_170471_c2~~gnl/TRDRNA2_/TRDRNA2_170471_c2_seq1.p1  ORF type:complete len:586 (+),score=65.55 gnl/TRDRNA2_/TRDRNA2_170471_c2_seq1:93-1760(+)